MSDSITIRDVGPIVEHVLPIAPGVTVLTGENETGKSTAICAVRAVAGADVSLSVRDGQKTGLIDGLGVTLTIGKRKTRTGELAAESIDDRLDISDLVEPPIKAVDRALKHRVRALISLQGTKLEVENFRGLLPEQWRTEIDDSTRDDDPVEMARKIKAKLDKRAREFEDQAENVRGQITALRGRLEGVDFSIESDERKLTKAVLEATKAKQALDSTLEEAVRKAAAIADAKEKVNNAAKAAGADLIAAQEAGVEATQAVEAARDAEAEALVCASEQATAVEELRRMLSAAEAKLATLATAAKSARATLEDKRKLETAADDRVRSIEAQIKNVEEFRELAKQVAPEPPSVDDLEAAEEAVNEALAASSAGSRIRELAGDKERLEKLLEEERSKVQTAVMFRNAGTATDDVLSQAVNARLLKIVGGDLVYVDGDRQEPYARLSEGKRWQVALVTAAEALAASGRLALVPVQQQAWEGLTHKNRKIVYETALEAGVAIVTAEKQSGAVLSSYRWQPTDA